MGLADRAAYAVILAHIGPVAMAVTSNLNFSFLRAVAARAVMADAVLLKLGRKLATVDVRLWQDDPGIVLGQATGTYAIPDAQRGQAVCRARLGRITATERAGQRTPLHLAQRRLGQFGQRHHAARMLEALAGQIQQILQQFIAARIEQVDLQFAVQRQAGDQPAPTRAATGQFGGSRDQQP